MPSTSPPLVRTVRRIGAAVVTLLGLIVLSLDTRTGPPVFGALIAWTAVVVSLGYLTVSLLAGAGRAFQPDDEAGSDSTGGGPDTPG